MITKQTTIYKCEHCPKWRQMKSAMEKHERHCTHNPNRVPKVGELYEEYSSWFFGDWKRDEATVPAIPTENGMIWTGKEWLPVPEYRTGRYGDPLWPSVGIYDNHGEGGTPLDKVPIYDRLLALEQDYGPTWAADERARRIEAAKPKMITFSGTVDPLLEV